jgi:hypothetical protein
LFAVKVDLTRFLADHDVALAVPTRDRSATLKKLTDTWLTDYHLFYSGEGYDDIEFNCVDRIKVPRNIGGLSPTRNFVLDRLKQKVVIMFDDDITAFRWVHGSKSIRLDQEQIKLMIMDLVVHALDQNVGMFGISNVDLRKSSPLIPFATRQAITTVIGVVGRQVRFDERQSLKDDHDFAMEGLKIYRTIHRDNRYMFQNDTDKLPGGSMEFRTQERRLTEVQNLIDWWGPDIVKPGTNKASESLSIHIPK